jgi:release factor-specific protein-(glutamine-N5) methyltransferase
MVISEAVRAAAAELNENARFEAELIVMHVTGITRTQLVTDGKKELSTDEEGQIKEITIRRKKGEPLQYILGECEFMSLPFRVREGVLIPRSDTETLVETALDMIDSKLKKNADSIKLLDICTGSGCVGISIAHYRKNVSALLLDISDIALETASENIVVNNLSDRVKAEKKDILSQCPIGRYDIIVSNPPYIETSVIDTLQTEVKDHEPHLALDGGEDGLLFYRRITEIAPMLLNDGAILAFEIGFNQGEAVKTLMEKSFEDVRIVKDLCENDRVVVGTLKNAEKEGKTE